MNLFILSQYKLIQELYKNDDFFEILINIDDFFDLINLYVFPNWLNAEVVNVDFLKYFTSITLKTPYDKMLHPKGAQLLLKYDCQVKYRETYEYVPKEVKSVEDTYVDKARNHATYAISKAGNLDIYYNYNGLSQSARKDLFDDIIKKGYLNTWTFRPAIMENGKVLSSDVLGTFLNSKAMRTIFCQVNHNNYVFLTSKSNQDINDIKKILTELNCQTAANLDGGGSRALIYKSKNGSIEIIAGDGRSVVDIVYVTEK